MRVDVIRAWKDADYRAGLKAEEQPVLPVNPAGWLELSQNELNRVNGSLLDEPDTYSFQQYCGTYANLCQQSCFSMCQTTVTF